MMYYRPNMGYILQESNYSVDKFRNCETLNIFSDGSYITKFRDGVGGYSAVGVVGNNITTVSYRGWSQEEPFSAILMELFGMREAISMAFMNKDIYPSINIFSDSIYTVNSIKNWIYSWRFDPKMGTYLKKSNRFHNNKKDPNSRIPSNINLIYEIATNFLNLMTQVPNLNLFWCKGHLDSMGSIQNLSMARKKFIEQNGINTEERFDLNFIRYMAIYNDVADSYAKKGIRDHVYNCNMVNAIEFVPQDINKIAQEKITENINFI